MSRLRLVPLAGLLAVLALAPAVLGDCGFPHGGSNNTSPPSFATQTTPTPPSPVAVAAYVLVPVGILGGVVAIARRLMPRAATGKWVATPYEWTWVEDKK